MKKFLLAVLVLVGFVVGLQGSQQIKVPDSLPYGANFPGGNVTIRPVLWELQPDGWSDAVAQKAVPYNGNDLRLATESAVRQLNEFRTSLSGREYVLDAEIGVAGVNIYGEPTEWPLAHWWEQYNYAEPFKLQEGKIPSELLKVSRIGYQPYMPAYVPGLKRVLLVVRKDSVEILREESENGVSDKTCTIYPGNGGYSGPNVLQLKTEYVVPEKRESGIEGEVTLYLSTDKSVWATYSLDGVKLASSEPVLSSVPPVPLALAISLVQLDDGGQIVLQSKKSLQWGLKLRVEGPAGKSVVLEYADKLGDDANWQRLTTVSLASGSAEHVDKSLPNASTRFYRVR